jgi:hypothetical protein
MTAEQTEVVSQDVAVERLSELSAERAAAYAAGQSAEDGARHGTEGDADRAEFSARQSVALGHT